MGKQDIIDRIKETGAVDYDGKIGASGKLIKPYIDLRLVLLSEPYLKEQILSEMAHIVDPRTNVVGGGGMGGSALAISYGMKYKLPVNVVRDAAKDHGTKKILEGRIIDYGEMSLFDDVLSTGESLANYYSTIKKQTRYEVIGVYTIVNGLDENELESLSGKLGGIKPQSLIDRKDFV